ncbi:hypothetical protein KRE49_11750 [Elizabethkingia meningoseptica]|uniref:terminase small subunit-like protein n=1 Tax=Elizabethkingia meningoseptica TaxID=238 RepID=UPI0023AF7EC3|nr:hypothetical protein [Elizabethkingia meningoseptica]MDE5516413.1 hypothetical protein [Elizabethkingia meningoseptica]MDE5526658.1 hypothetical protein [Elizabethkingia meningoseptica]MDN4033729.1 hypothetical protein [Elizabethkingia meningoseptica]
MAYSVEQKEQIFKSIFESIENGNSLRKALTEASISSKTFYEWLEADEEKVKQYARATEERAEALVDEILDIADDTSQDFIDIDMGDEKGSEIVLSKKPNYELIQRSRLRVDARKWLVGKLAPKKYGDKLDIETSGNLNISWNEEKTYEK